MSRSRRLLILGVAMVVAMVLTATGGIAGPKTEHFKETNEFTIPHEDNPCTPELDDITLNITEHVQGKTWTEDGTTFFDVHVSANADGAAADGTEYVAKFNAKFSGMENGEVSQDFQIVFRMVSNGATPNFLVQEKGTFTAPPPEVTFERQRVECRG